MKAVVYQEPYKVTVEEMHLDFRPRGDPASGGREALKLLGLAGGAVAAPGLFIGCGNETNGRTAMQITRNSSTETAAGPSEWFTGAVYVDTLAAPSGPSRLGAASAHFAPSARTAWHTYPFGQTIYVTEGVGLCQRHGGPVEAIRPGDRVFFEPGEDHWHGAARNRFVTHIAMQEADDSGSPVSWGEHVTDEEYGEAPPINS